MVKKKKGRKQNYDCVALCSNYHLHCKKKIKHAATAGKLEMFALTELTARGKKPSLLGFSAYCPVPPA